MADKSITQFAKYFSADRPIQARPEDRLGRRRFAEALARAVTGWTQQDSLVIAIYGPWGIGKSSIKNMLLDTLRSTETPEVIIAEFNPWQFANRGQLQEAFFDQVGIALGTGDVATRTQRQRLLRRWQRYAAYLTAGKTIGDLIRKPVGWVFVLTALVSIGSQQSRLPSLGYTVNTVLLVIGLLLAFSAKVAEAVTSVLKIGVDVGRKSIDEVKAELGATLKEVNVPVIIVLDDVDRLTPAETLELLQIVKANVDLPNVVFVLLCDRALVASHIEAILGTSGAEFLEKIVQVPFDVPAVERVRMLKVLTDGLDAILALDPTLEQRFDQARWGNIFVDGLDQYFENLRDVNRYLSTLAFHVGLFQGEVAFEVNVIDLIALEALRLFEPDLHRRLPSHKSALTSHFRFGSQRADAEKHRITSLLDHVPATRKDQVQRILTQLFPPSEWAFGGSNYGADFEEVWTRDLRVCADDIFDRYFNLAIPQGDLSQDVITRLLTAADDREDLAGLLRALNAEGLLESTLDRLEAYKQTVPVASLETFITALFDVGDEVSDDMDGMFALSPLMHLWRIVFWALKNERALAARGQILLKAIGNTTGVSAPVQLVAIESQAAAKEGERREELLLRPEDLETAKALCVQKIRTAAETGRLADLPGALSLLYRWRDWEGEDGPRAFCETLASTSEGAAKLAKIFVGRSTSTTIGDRVSRVSWYVKLSTLEHFVPADQMDASLKSVDVAHLKPDEARAVTAFRVAMERRRAGKPESDLPFDRDDE